MLGTRQEVWTGLVQLEPVNEKVGAAKTKTNWSDKCSVVFDLRKRLGSKKIKLATFSPAATESNTTGMALISMVWVKVID